MNIKELREIIGGVVVFRPRPKTNNFLVKDAYNSWIIVSEVEEKKFLFKNTSTNHEVVLSADNINQFRNPNFLILHGQASMDEKGGVNFEPFTPGIKDGASPSELIDDSRKMPDFEVLQGFLRANVIATKTLGWYLDLPLYVATKSIQPVIIPFHRCQAVSFPVKETWSKENVGLQVGPDTGPAGGLPAPHGAVLRCSCLTTPH